MKKQCFLNIVFSSGSKRLYQLVIFSVEDFLEFEVLYTDAEGIKKIIDSGEYDTDFRVENDYLVWEGEDAPIDEAQIAKYVGAKLKVSTVNDNLYKKLSDLIKMGATYVSSVKSEMLEDGDEFPREGVNFLGNLRISKSSMGLFLSVKYEDGWRTRTLVGNTNGLELHPFNVLVKQSNLDESILKCDGITKVKEVILQTEKYVILNVGDGISLYPQFSPAFTLQSPYINYKTYRSELNNRSIDLLDLVIAKLEESVYGVVEDENKAPYTRTKETNPNGVFFDFQAKKLSGNRKVFLVEFAVNNLFAKLNRKELEFKDIVTTLRNSQLDNRESHAVLSLLYVLINTRASSTLERLDSMIATRRAMRIDALVYDLELFAMRAYMYMTGFSLPNYENSYMAIGGNSVFGTSIRKVGSAVGSV